MFPTASQGGTKGDAEKFQPTVIKPFAQPELRDLTLLLAKLRWDCQNREFDDWEEPQNSPKKFNRWTSHNHPAILKYHQQLVPLACRIFGRSVRPSYCYISLYGKDGICAPHVDRKQCEYTIDLCVHQREPWSLYVEGTPYELTPGEALCFMGARQVHWRERIQPGNYCDLIFFHFVPSDFEGLLD